MMRGSQPNKKEWIRMKKLLKGGVIVGASGCRKADLLIDGDRI